MERMANIRLRGRKIMVMLNFPNFSYFPVLSSGDVERIAYEHLADETRAGILPIFELARIRSSESFHPSCHLLQEFIRLPIILDLDKRVAPPPYRAANPSNPVAEQSRIERETAENDAFNNALNSLLTPANGFENWR